MPQRDTSVRPALTRQGISRYSDNRAAARLEEATPSRRIQRGQRLPQMTPNPAATAAVNPPGKSGNESSS